MYWSRVASPKGIAPPVRAPHPFYLTRGAGTPEPHGVHICHKDATAWNQVSPGPESLSLTTPHFPFHPFAVPTWWIMDCPQLAPEDFAKRKFDFIIVGGGTAGLAVAARLSEHPGFTVGVLEAGSPAVGDNAVEFPGLAGRALGTPLDWGFETVPQKFLGGRRLPWARGKVLGGSSALNYMTWNRAARQDYDDWRDLGNPGWGWDNLLPFFKKSESFHEPGDSVRKETPVSLHDGVVGRSGPIQVSYPREFTASHKLWHRTMNSLGVETNHNHLAGSNIGCWTSVVSVDPEDITRSYATTAYYKPVSSRPNLFLLTAAEVHEVLLTREGNAPNPWKAEGVRFSHGGVEFSAFAAREVILSAGSIQSPQILELSGVGVANTHQNKATTSVFEVNPSLANPDDLRLDSVLAAACEEYAETRTGPLTILPVSVSYVPAARYIRPDTLNMLLSSTAADTSDSPTAERSRLIRRRFQSRSNMLGHVEFIFDLGNWGIDKPPLTSDGKKYGSLLQILQYPFSKGSVHIQPPVGDSNPRPRLAIDPQYFGGREGHLDLEIALRAHRFAEKIWSAQPLASIIRAQVQPSLAETGTDEDLRSWLRRVATTDWHPVGTCAMGGSAGSAGGVVDERLRVYGVKGLRVVDASVMPLQISAHLQATVNRGQCTKAQRRNTVNASLEPVMRVLRTPNPCFNFLESPYFSKMRSNQIQRQVPSLPYYSPCRCPPALHWESTTRLRRKRFSPKAPRAIRSVSYPWNLRQAKADTMLPYHSLSLWLLAASSALVHASPASTRPDFSNIIERAVAATSSSGCGKTPFSSGTKSVTVNGKQRQFIVRVPSNYDQSKPYKLIFAFHWVGGTMQDVSSGGTDKELWSYYGMQREAGETAILVAPQGINNGWANSGGEDIAFVDAMSKYIEDALCVDQQQRFSVGFSYGGAMTYAIACARAKNFKGVAVIAGGQLSGCDGGNDPVAYLGIHGISDGTLNIAGGRGLRDRFVKNNGCATTNAPEPAQGSRTHIKTEYTGCKAGYPVTWIAHDGGHWPGAVDNGPESGANSWVPGEIWSFFTNT
ncbi:hypothetical protein CHGG_05258 [Chaetomium globosum CBS 148.51]|uniref:Glucose-methanol-choline oxidoreductase N-terminal domain-containing protein n=1 Tax=Chaetomium globosum (strain ATCC 6205 / CBS 148.51 / DSM 1962 / NBRC 6347 / NRRL 1970) TaxID=306901 RepID=Q2GYY8_CHAGB|nr:uncharacterized protein CHGG_05258 [Chaetomium globosum CBS 148.51]EAQ88639.1 hypothetical protein CHGG_05258 [Chaetomium globosum CBS 148.51]